jgi:hypothetical protein
MSVQLRDRNIKEPKELGEIYDAVEGLLGAVLGEGNKGENALAELPKLLKAAEGFSAVKEEVKHETVYEASGAFTGRVAKIILKK